MKEYKIGGIPVVNDDQILIGIVTNRDLRFENHLDKKIVRSNDKRKYHYYSRNLQI